MRDIVFATSCLSLGVMVGCNSGDAKLDPATNHFVEAQKAIESGDLASAQQHLTQSLNEKSTTWAYLQRAQLHLEQGNETEAIADIDAGLQLNPNDRDLQWYRKELSKPQANRFKGANSRPPSLSK